MIRLTQIASYSGPSLYGRTPVMRATVALESPDDRFACTPREAVTRALASLAPGLSEQLTSGEAGDHDCPIWTNKWLDTVRLCLALGVEILRGTGADPEHAAVIEDSWGTHMVLGYENPQVYAGALQTAVGLVNGFVLAPVNPSTIDQLVAEGHQAVDVFYKQARQVNWYLDMRALVRDARALDIPVQVLMHNVIMLGQGRNRRMMMATSTDATSYFSYFVSSDKSLAIELMRQHGLPVPTQRVVTSPDQARAAAEEIGYPVAVKPTSGGKAQGVTADVRSDKALLRAFERARKYGNNVIVETFLRGRPHRFTVIGGTIANAAVMTPANVVGDGTRTIAQLVEEANRDPRRSPKSGFWYPLVLDDEVLDTLGNAGYIPDSVPPAGERVHLSSTGNASRGGTWEFIEDIHPDVVEAVELAHLVLGLDISGVDIILPDASKTWKGSGGGFCEVNSMPGVWGVPHVTTRIFEYLFPEGKTPRIPVAGILGTQTGPRTAQILANILQEAGRTVGLACAEGCRVNDSVIGAGDASDPRHALQIQRDPRIDSAVVQTSADQVRAQGFGFQLCDVAAVTDAMSGTGDVERLLGELTTGTLVLNADDPRCPELVLPENKPRVCLVGQDENNKTVAAHIESGGDAVRLEQDGKDSWIVIHRAGESQRLHRIEHPSDAQDKTLLAILMATALATAMGVTMDVLKPVLDACIDAR